MANKTYPTTGGESWAYVAYKAYGDAFNIKPITDANPAVRLDALLPAGLILQVPVLNIPADQLDAARLPFWKVS